MNNKITNKIKAIILGLVITVGVGYAAAQNFTGPTCSPTANPGCNTPAPVNVGGNDAGITPYSQLKTGLLTLMHVITPDLTVTNSDGVTPVIVGQVLTATDTSGRVGWATPASAASVPSGMISYTTPGSYTWTIPAGAKFAEITVVGGGGSAYVRQGGSNVLVSGSGGVAIKIVPLTGINTSSITVGAGSALSGYSGAASSVTIGATTISASGGGASNGIGSGGDFNGYGLFNGYGASGTYGGAVVIKYY